MDLDLLYVKYRQQELSQEAAAQALAAKVRPAGRRWWGRLLDTLTTRFSGGPWQASRRSHPCPVPAVARIAPPTEERKYLW